MVENRVDGGVHMTRLGGIVLRGAHELDQETSQPGEVLFSANDACATHEVLKVIRQAEPCLLVDPYCREEQLNDLARYTEVSRVPVGPRVSAEEFGLTLDRVWRPSELRVSPDVHDRQVIPGWLTRSRSAGP